MKKRIISLMIKYKSSIISIVIFIIGLMVMSIGNADEPGNNYIFLSLQLINLVALIERKNRKQLN